MVSGPAWIIATVTCCPSPGLSGSGGSGTPGPGISTDFSLVWGGMENADGRWSLGEEEDILSSLGELQIALEH